MEIVFASQRRPQRTRVAGGAKSEDRSRQSNEEPPAGPTPAQRSGRTLLIIVVAVGMLIAEGLVVLSLWDGKSSELNQQWFGHLSSALVLIAATVLLTRTRGGVGSLVMGADDRLSTSKLQALLWTYALAFALLSLLFAKWGGLEDGYDALLSEGLKDEYLLLLGGPFAAAIAAKAIVSTKLENGTLTKPDGSAEATAGERAKEAVSDDAGSTDLVDSQYLLFNVVALTFFVGAFFTESTDGLPEIPELLVGLTGVAAATYVSNKAVQRNAPVLSSVLPSTGPVGKEVEIFGKHLLAEDVGQVLRDDDARVYFDGRRATVVPNDFVAGSAGDDRLKVLVPLAPAGGVKVVVANAAGVLTQQVDFTIEAAVS